MMRRHVSVVLRELNRESRDLDRRTKIICTIGPKTQPVDALCQLIEAGMNVVRMNFSHGTHEFHATTIKNTREACKRMNARVAIMLDTKGPEIRTGKLKGGGTVMLEAGQQLRITTEPVEGDSKQIHVDYQQLPSSVDVGKIIKIDDGLIHCRVEEISADLKSVLCTVLNSAELGETKGVNLPGCVVQLPAITDKDKSDLLFGVEMGVDIIAASFVRKADDVRDIRAVLGEAGAYIKICSKIESQEGLLNFDEILQESDAIMVARGDLGVEIPVQKVCVAQKVMIQKCNVAGKPVVTATQMLESMVNNPRPTRAEATDVANAIFDGTDCVMLSGETAKGKYPQQAVQIMARICRTTEVALDYASIYFGMLNMTPRPLSGHETIASSAVKTAGELSSRLIIVHTDSGLMARLVAKYKPFAKILIMCTEQVARQLQLVRGLFPVVTSANTMASISDTVQVAIDNGFCRSGEPVVVVSGVKEDSVNHIATDLIKTLTIK